MSNKFIKSLSLALSLSFVIVSTLASCGTTKNDSSSTESTLSDTTKAEATTAAKTDKIKIRIMTRWTGSDANTPALQKLVNDFNAENTNIEIMDESISDGAAYSNKVKTQVATGNIPHIFNPEGSSYDYAKNGIILDLKPYFDEDTAWSGGFISGIIDSLGKFPDLPGRYIFPTDANFEPFYYNTELFAKAGITKAPETYEELLANIVKLKDAGIVPIGAGAKDTWRLMHLHTGIWMKLLGVDKAFNLGTGKTKFTDPDVINTFKKIKELSDIGAFDKNMAGIDYASEQTNFLAGKTAMMYNGTWFVGNISNSPIKDKIKTFLMPVMSEAPQNKNTDVLYSGGWACSNFVKDDAEKAAMITVAKHLSGPIASDVFVELAKKPSVRTDGKVSVSDPLLLEIINLEKGITGGTDVSSYTFKGKMMEIIGNNLVAVAMGSKTPEEVGKILQSEMEKD